MLQTVVTQSLCQLYGCILDSFPKAVVFSTRLSVVKVLDPGKADVRILVEDPFSLAVVCEIVCDWYEVLAKAVPSSRIRVWVKGSLLLKYKLQINFYATNAYCCIFI